MDLQEIKGLGEKNIETFSKAGIVSLQDLIHYYPYRYQILSPTNILFCHENETVTLNAEIIEIGKVAYIRPNFNSLRLKVQTDGMIINVIIFNRGFMRSKLKIGQNIIITGKYKISTKTFTANTLKIGKLKDDEIIPMYHSIKGLKSVQIEKIMAKVLKKNITDADYIPYVYLKKYHFMDKKTALLNIHKPQDVNSLNQAKQRLIYEELFVFLFKMQYLQNQKIKEATLSKKIDLNQVKSFINNLPFTLTNDQISAIKDGLKDFISQKRMNRLLLGDVGSGKTIVAITLMYANYLAGFQSAFMAPTEILATQHFYSVYNLLKPYNIEVELLIGSMTKREKNRVIEKVKNNEVSILIGTHAILNDELIFANLGFVITDEQHRFGVNQRTTLQNKGIKPDVLFMSATPIPRTYALTIYGDMDTSFIKQKPNGRMPVITKVKKENELKEVLYQVLEEIKKNYQVYVVAPMIVENEDTNLKNVTLLKEKFALAFHNKVPTDILHGKLKNKEKDEIMNRFKNGETKILISTTVIEVGVDVPKATTIIIFNAERFGLATLHQLRGRVGRNNLQGYCYLICNQDIERLKVLEESNDGFYISEKDFQFRGEGDLFGEKQSGDMSFSLANIKRDYNILLQAKEDVVKWMMSNEYQTNVNYKEIVKQMKFNN